MLRRSAVSLIAALAVLAVPAAASAKTNVSVGIGDQSPSMFSAPLWQALHLKKTRYFIEWNAADQGAELQKAVTFVTAAKAHGVKVLMHISTDNINATPRSPLPSVAAYKTKVKALIAIFKPLGVTDWGAWNEANHKSQPTQTNPKRAAQFFLAMRSLCTGCTIVALDVLDQSGVEKYINKWFKALGSKRTTAKVIGIHNYSEVNRKLKEKRSKSSIKKYPGTKRIIDAARSHNRSVKFWYTETGGIVKLASAFSCSPTRAADRIKFMFTLAKKYRKYVKRLYTFNWSPTPDCSTTARFDAGLIEPSGLPRPGYNVLKSQLKNFTK
ncbi:MAG: hypothetical protein QOG15_499 [Solirubrobacteraceae bacterium]|nr:hypothetical protein [Solirubrobacteraceae bacterium]